MNESKLLKILPEYICTPDGMEAALLKELCE